MSKDVQVGKLFYDIVRDVLIENVGEAAFRQMENVIPFIPCPDQYVGSIRDFADGGADDFSLREDIEDVFECDGDIEDVVIVILESPHKKEFVRNDEGWLSLGPAQSCTGRRLRAHWAKVFAKTDIGIGGNLFLVNAVRYQCSLGSAGCMIADGKLRKKLKKEILRKCILCSNDRCLEDLSNRIEMILSHCVRPCVIINASTRSNGCDKCHDAISGLLGRYYRHRLYETTHPSSWHSPFNRWIKAMPL